MKLYNLINPKIIILISFIISLLISNYNLNTYDDFLLLMVSYPITNDQV